MKTPLLLISAFVISHFSFSQIQRFHTKKPTSGWSDYIPKTLPDPAATLELDLQAGFPEGEFRDVYPQPIIWGIGVGMLFPIEKSNPLDLGFELGFYPLAQYKEKFEYYAPGIGDYDVNVSVDGNMTPFHLVARIYPLKMFRSPIQPYVQGLAGFRSFSVKQEFTTFLYQTGGDLPSEKFRTRTWAWSYGLGVGVKVWIKDEFYVSFKVDRLFGGTTRYIDPTSIVVNEDSEVFYNELTSATQILRYSLGVHGTIDRKK